MKMAFKRMDSDRNPRSRIKRTTSSRLRNRYVIGLTMLAALMIARQVVVQLTINSQTQDASVINLAGSQRMLSQKISKLALEIANSDHPRSSQKCHELKETITLFETNHRWLSQRGRNETGHVKTSVINSREIQHQFIRIQPYFRQLTTGGILIANEYANNTEQKTGLMQVLENEVEFLPRMHQIVNTLQLEAEQRVHFLKRIELILLMVTLTVLLSESFLIFEPAIQTIHQQFEKLKSQLRDNLDKSAQLRELASELENRTTELNAVLHSVSEGIIAADHEGKILFCNKSANDLFDLDSTKKFNFETLPQEFGFIDPENGELIASEDSPLLRAIKGQRVIDREVLIRIDGDARSIIINGSPITLNGQPGGVMVCRDISNEKEAQKLSQNLNLERQKSARRAGMAEVAVDMIHNVGNVLNSVNVSVGILQEHIRNQPSQLIGRIAETVPDDQQALLEFAKSDKGRMLPQLLRKYSNNVSKTKQLQLDEIASLIQSVEEVNRIVAAQQPISEIESQPEWIQIEDLIEEAIATCVSKWNQRTILFIRNFGATPAIHGKPFDISQILVNVIRNAMEASIANSDDWDHRITIVTQSNNDSVSVEISDHGVGIEEADLIRVFQLGYSTKPSRNGLSLHASANAAQKMGGNLTAKSDGNGLGSTFILTIPVGSEVARSSQNLIGQI